MTCVWGNPSIPVLTSDGQAATMFALEFLPKALATSFFVNLGNSSLFQTCSTRSNQGVYRGDVLTCHLKNDVNESVVNCDDNGVRARRYIDERGVEHRHLVEGGKTLRVAQNGTVASGNLYIPTTVDMSAANYTYFIRNGIMRSTEDRPEYGSSSTGCYTYEMSRGP